jgi:hypothetical protein
LPPAPGLPPRFIDSVSSNKCLARSFQGAILTGPTSRPPPLKNVLSPGQDARSDEYQRRFDYLYKAGDWQPFGYIYTGEAAQAAARAPAAWRFGA